MSKNLFFESTMQAYKTVIEQLISQKDYESALACCNEISDNGTGLDSKFKSYLVETIKSLKQYQLDELDRDLLTI